MPLLQVVFEFLYFFQLQFLRCSFRQYLFAACRKYSYTRGNQRIRHKRPSNFLSELESESTDVRYCNKT